MKTKYLIITFLIGISFSYSCTKKNTNPVLKADKIVKSQLTEPLSGTSYTLTKDNAEQIVDAFNWTKADYGIPIGISYFVELDTTGNDFTNSQIIFSGYDTSFSINQEDLNKAMLTLELPFEEESKVDLRVASVVSGYDTIYSDHINLNIIPYDASIPLYILGNATSAGWNNATALQMDIISTGVYEITTDLTGGSGNYLKFIAVLGQWAPQWGTDGSGTWDAGNLVYRPTEDVPDPAAIPAPPTNGTYIIRADINELTYTVTQAK